MFAVLKKELKAHFTSLSTYIFYALFLLTVGVLFSHSCLTTYTTQFGYYVLSRAFFIILAFLPLCTMRTFAQERRSKTDQLLFTAPISVFSILLGKYLATLVMVLLPIVLTGAYAFLIASYGEMSIPFLMSTYFAMLLVVILAITIGMFISALTSNVVVATILTYSVFVAAFLERILEKLVLNEHIYNILYETSIYNKYNNMISGIVKSGDVLYLVALTICFFILNWLALLGRRQNIKPIIGKSAVVILLTVICCIFAIHYTKVYDFTAERLLSLSGETKKIVKNIDKVTDIYYIGDRNRMNATYDELLKKYHDLNDNIKVHYKDIRTDKEFREKYLSNIVSVNEASILVVSGEKFIYLDSSDYVTTVVESEYSSRNILEIENQITSAIYFTNSEIENETSVVKGHGELSIPSAFSNILMINNYKIKEINFSEEMHSFKQTFAEIDKPMIIYSPNQDFSKEEIDMLKQFIEKGGKVFISINPLNENLKNLYGFLKEYGLRVNRGIVVEPNLRQVAYETTHYIMPTLEDTEITRSLEDDNLRVTTMISKGITTDQDKKGYTVTDILTTSNDSYSKVEDFDHLDLKSENDIHGPFSVAALSQNSKNGSVFLLTSNAFFDKEVDEASMHSNRKFFLAVMNYLTDSDNEIMIEGKDISSQKALYPNQMQFTLKMITIFVIPVVILLSGSFVILYRWKGYQWKKKYTEKQVEE